MSSNKDSRGIARGQCTLCACDSYAGGSEGLKCYRCKHAPAQHKNLSTPKTSTHPTGFGSRDTRTLTFAQAAGSSGSSVYQGSHSHHSGYQHRHVPRNLPKCKADRCSNRVHYEEGVGEFDYCSPGCRDKHLLPTEQKNLKKDLEDLAKHLHVHVAPKQSKNKPPDLERQFSGGNQVPQQRTVQVFFDKMEGKDFGVILNEELFPLATSMSGFLVTGVSLRSKAYAMLKTREILLLDIITYLNGQPIECLGAPFDEEVKKLGSGSLVINRSRTIKCPFTLLDKVGLLKDATHVIAMRNTGGEKFGIETTMKAERGLIVTRVLEGSIAKQSGIIPDSDVILMYAVPAENLETIEKTEGKPTESGFRQDLKDAVKKGRPMIVVIARKSDTDSDVHV